MHPICGPDARSHSAPNPARSSGDDNAVYCMTLDAGLTRGLGRPDGAQLDAWADRGRVRLRPGGEAG